MKSYFDPVLEKNTTNRKTREMIVSNLKLQDESIALFENYDKINSFHIYTNQRISHAQLQIFFHYSLVYQYKMSDENKQKSMGEKNKELE